jgi:hypothetical protein
MNDTVYEVLSPQEVRQLRAAFDAELTAKAQKAIPAGNTNPGLLPALKDLIVAARHKGIELKPDDLAAVASSGVNEAERRRIDYDKTLHVGMPDVTQYPSPQLAGYQKARVAAAAAKRHEDEAVKNAFAGEERLYLRIKAGAQGETEKEIDQWLTRAGYRMVDYAGGYATDAAGKQQFKIGKLLKDNERLKEKFRVDPSRAAPSLLAVISRNPDDIATMATGRAWSSCMGSGGMNFTPYVPEDVRQGALVAYLVSEKDPDIVDPLARIVIKPYAQQGIKCAFRSAVKYLRGEDGSRPEVFAMNKSYGLPNEAFKKAVEQFVEDRLNAGKEGEFKLREGLYADGLPPEQLRDKGRTLRRNGLSILA